MLYKLYPRDYQLPQCMLKRARAVEHWQLDLMDHANHTPHLLRTRFSAPWRTEDGWNPHQKWDTLKSGIVDIYDKFGRWCSESRTKRRLHVTWKRVVKRSASLSSMFKTTANRSRRLYCWGTEWTWEKLAVPDGCWSIWLCLSSKIPLPQQCLTYYLHNDEYTCSDDSECVSQLHPLPWLGGQNSNFDP